jgi:hypothetical protein
VPDTATTKLPPEVIAHALRESLYGETVHIDLLRVERLERFESILRPIVEFTCTHGESTYLRSEWRNGAFFIHNQR